MVNTLANNFVLNPLCFQKSKVRKSVGSLFIVLAHVHSFVNHWKIAFFLGFGIEMDVYT